MFWWMAVAGYARRQLGAEGVHSCGDPPRQLHEASTLTHSFYSKQDSKITDLPATSRFISYNCLRIWRFQWSDHSLFLAKSSTTYMIKETERELAYVPLDSRGLAALLKGEKKKKETVEGQCVSWGLRGPSHPSGLWSRSREWGEQWGLRRGADHKDSSALFAILVGPCLYCTGSG